MKAKLSHYVESQGHKGIDIGITTDLLRRYVYIEQSCVRALAGWFLKAPQWEVKIDMGYYLFAHAERVFELYGRLDEMRGGNRNANVEPLLDRLGEELIHAPDEQSFLEGLAVVLQKLLEAYREYLESADESANAMEIRILRRLIPDAAIELEKVSKLHSSLKSNKAKSKLSWAHYIAKLLTQAGGIGGDEARVVKADGEMIKGGESRDGGEAQEDAKPQEDGIQVNITRFEWPIPIYFDDRMHNAELGTYESKMSLPLRERCIGEFEVYFNEFYAAALLATVIYDSWKLNAPRKYFLDIAHHFWDEVRHAEFGALRLREIGVEPHKVNMVLFEQSRNMPMMHRICHLAMGLEIFFMPRKSERARYYEQQGDTRSQLFATVDWSDEINHVRYGKEWVEYFLKDDNRTMEDIQQEIAVYLEEYTSQVSDGRKAPW